MKQANLRKLTTASIFAALIFLFTFTFKIPNISGYTHIGDAFIVLGIFFLDWKYATLAAGVGAALADLIGGYPLWVGPTFLIKATMVLLSVFLIRKVFHENKLGTVVAFLLSGAWQVLGYYVASALMFDRAYAIASVPGNAVQSGVGIAAALVLVTALRQTGQLEKLRALAART